MDAAEFDARMMRLALATARRGLGQTAPNPAVGAVLADPASGEILARAVTARGGRPHAEPQALEQAGPRAQGATLYVTLEPCAHHGQTPPCVETIIAAGVARVVVGVQDPDARVAGRGLSALRAAGLSVQSGVCGRDAAWVVAGHSHRITHARPFVQMKLAMASDGCIPRGKDGKPRWVTGTTARAMGHQLRARADAILIGGATLREDDPNLTCRLPGLADRSPVRVIVTSTADGVAQSKVYKSRNKVPVWIVAADDAGRVLHEDLVSLSRPTGASAALLCVPDVLDALADRGVTRLLIEGGTHMWRWFAASGLVDEIIVFVGAFDGHGADACRHVQNLVTAHLERDPGAAVDARGIGDDGCFTFRPKWDAS